MKIKFEELSEGELKETYEYLRILHRICIILAFALILLALSDNAQKELQKRRWERYK